jgi:hypothetical protein
MQDEIIDAKNKKCWRNGFAAAKESRIINHARDLLPRLVAKKCDACAATKGIVPSEVVVDGHYKRLYHNRAQSDQEQRDCLQVDYQQSITYT